MDIDGYIATNEATWQRLAELTNRARLSVRTLEPEDLEELVQLYQRTSSHLSYVRTYLREPALVNRLTGLVAGANGVIYGRRRATWDALVRFFTLTYPGAVYHYRRFVAVAALLFFGPALVMGVWLVNDPDALDESASKRDRIVYVEDLFESYYSDRPSAQFFTEVTVNNIRVAFLAFALGTVTLGLGAVWLLVLNGSYLGVVASWMITEGDAGRFFAFIVPHGALELTAIVIAGATGLAMGWSVIAPGDRNRGEAFGEEGLRAVTIVLGLMTMFALAGLVEGFITGSGLPTWARVGIGVLLWIVYVGYLVSQGRIAASRGVTGTIGRRRRRWEDEPLQDLPVATVVAPR
ncbi:MAG: stage II sporulation protein M [Acidimicrobiales bacterium]|nr:stage II sporulation protein M [Acidimicrobiales bacterium]